MTVTRLRSDKGSFVQSPLKSFETVGDAAVSGFVNTVADDPAASWALYPGCIQQGTALGNTGTAFIQFNYLSGTRVPPAQLITYLHVGQNSGAMWRPIDDLVSLSCAVDTPVDPSYIESWVGPDSVPVGSGVVYKTNLMLFQSPVAQLQWYVNYGEFPGSTQAAFIPGEPIIATP